VGNNLKHFEPNYSRPVINMTFINPRLTCYLFSSLSLIQSFVDHIPLFCFFHFKKHSLLTNLHLPEGEGAECSVYHQQPVLTSPPHHHFNSLILILIGLKEMIYSIKKLVTDVKLMLNWRDKILDGELKASF
jgi:hypothetical protein